VPSPRIRAALVVLAASAGLAGCTSFGPYGGVSVGYGSYGYGSYGYDPYYAGYGYGYDPFGWYNGFYYPGSGRYCYDRNHHRRELTAEERAYWHDRIHRRTGVTGTSASIAVKENWSGFNRPDRAAVATGADASTTAGTSAREAFRQRVIERQQAMEQARSERAEARSERSEVRQQSSDDGDHPHLHRRPR
jgi:hypothetical protein